MSDADLKVRVMYAKGKPYRVFLKRMPVSDGKTQLAVHIEKIEFVDNPEAKSPTLSRMSPTFRFIQQQLEKEEAPLSLGGLRAQENLVPTTV